VAHTFTCPVGLALCWPAISLIIQLTFPLLFYRNCGRHIYLTQRPFLQRASFVLTSYIVDQTVDISPLFYRNCGPHINLAQGPLLQRSCFVLTSYIVDQTVDISSSILQELWPTHLPAPGAFTSTELLTAVTSGKYRPYSNYYMPGACWGLFKYDRSWGLLKLLCTYYNYSRPFKRDLLRIVSSQSLDLRRSVRSMRQSVAYDKGSVHRLGYAP
jgi:hypothetical protein